MNTLDIAAPPPAPSLSGLCMREIRSELTRALRMPEYAAPTIVLPWMFYALFALLLPSPGSGRAEYLLATYGVFAALGPSLFGLGAGLGYEREQGILTLKQISPLPPGAYLLAKLVTAMLLTLFVLLGLYALAAWCGGVDLAASVWLRLLAVHLCGAIPFGLLGLCIGIILQGAGAMAVTNLIFLELAVFGGLWFPLSLFPQCLQSAASVLPSFHLAQLALMTIGHAADTAAAVHLLGVLVFTIACAAVSGMSWRRAQI